MNALTGELFIAWTNESMAYAPSEEDAIDRLFSDEDEIKPFRVARFEVHLPKVETMDGGTLSVGPATAGKPKLVIIAGTEAS